MTRYQCRVTLGIRIRADSKDEAEQLTNEFEVSLYSMFHDNVEVQESWKSEVARG